MTIGGRFTIPSHGWWHHENGSPSHPRLSSGSAHCQPPRAPCLPGPTPRKLPPRRPGAMFFRGFRVTLKGNLWDFFWIFLANIWDQGNKNESIQDLDGYGISQTQHGDSWRHCHPHHLLWDGLNILGAIWCHNYACLKKEALGSAGVKWQTVGPNAAIDMPWATLFMFHEDSFREICLNGLMHRGAGWFFKPCSITYSFDVPLQPVRSLDIYEAKTWWLPQLFQTTLW